MNVGDRDVGRIVLDQYPEVLRATGSVDAIASVEREVSEFDIGDAPDLYLRVINGGAGVAKSGHALPRAHEDVAADGNERRGEVEDPGGPEDNAEASVHRSLDSGRIDNRRPRWRG